MSTSLTLALNANAGNCTWVAATTGDNEAASLELATGNAVMSLGGYNGTDPSITLASTAYQIQQWALATFTAKSVGGTTVYDLTASD